MPPDSGVGRQAIAVDMADLRFELPGDRPGDQCVGLELGDLHRHVVAAELREVVERLAIHVNDERVSDGGDDLAVGGLQHSRGVDRDVTLRVAQHGEDVRGGRGDCALDFNTIGHGTILTGASPTLSRMRALTTGLRGGGHFRSRCSALVW